MLTRQIIHDAQQQINALHANIHQTFDAAQQNPALRSSLRKAQDALYANQHPTDMLEDNAFLERVRQGEKEAVQDAILFLEVDPWYFRSGYIKARLCRALKAAPLKAANQRRLLNMVYIAAMGKHRQEFREMCSLARKLATPEFTQKIRSRAAMYDPQSKNSFQYLLRKIDAPGTR